MKLVSNVSLFTPLAISVLALVGTMGCGPEPEPETAAKRPMPTSTVTATATTPPPPVEATAEQHKAAGKAAYEAKDYAKARFELNAVVAKDPNDVEAHTMLGEIHSAENDAKGATDEYYAASKADGGKNEQLALTAALGLSGQKRFDDVITLMQLTTKANANSVPAWMYLAMAQTAKGDYAGASETYGKLTQTMPDEPMLWAQLAVSQAAAGKKDDAKKNAKAALDKWTEVRDPKSKKDVRFGKGADQLAIVARAMRRAGDAGGALAALGKYTVPKDETAPMLDVERGMAKRAKKDASAKADADKAVKAAGDSFAPAHLLMAGLAADAKKPDEAKAHLSSYEKFAGSDYGYAFEAKEIEAAMNAPADPPKDPKKPATPPPAPPKTK